MSDPLTDTTLAIDPQPATPAGDDALLADLRRDADDLRRLAGKLAALEDAAALRWVAERMAGRAEALAARYTRALRAIQTLARRLAEAEAKANAPAHLPGNDEGL